MSSRMRSIVLRSLILTMGVSLISCQTLVRETPTDFEALQDASDAYNAYQAGDCVEARRLSNPRRTVAWEPNETLHSMLLLNAFCHELDGNLDAARRVYDRLIDDAPNSFAARDAKERSRILRIQESDPNHAAWMRSARERALAAQSSPQTRIPVERQPAIFPPVARTAGIEGYAVVEFGVTPRGTTSDPVIIDSHPPLVFDGTSLRAIRRWEYERRARASTNDLQVIRLKFVSADPESALDAATSEASSRPQGGNDQPSPSD